MMHKEKGLPLLLKFKTKNSAHENGLPSLLKFKGKNGAHEKGYLQCQNSRLRLVKYKAI